MDVFYALPLGASHRTFTIILIEENNGWWFWYWSFVVLKEYLTQMDYCIDVSDWNITAVNQNSYHTRLSNDIHS